MINEKMERFIESIIEKTEQDLVPWKAGRHDDFTFSTPKATVYISQADDIDSEKRITSLYIYNENGKIVDFAQLNNHIIEPEDSNIESLYNYARRTAYNANDLLDSIIHDIENPEEDSE